MTASVPIELMGLKFDEGFRADLLAENRFLIELKSVERLLPVHSKQVLTYLRLLRLPLGLLINYGSTTFKEGVHRIANQHQNFASSREPTHHGRLQFIRYPPRLTHDGRGESSQCPMRTARPGRWNL